MLATIENWYDNPLGFVDAEDINDHKIRAIELLRDKIVGRIVEMDVLYELFKQALKKPIYLLPSQQTTYDLALEAKQLGITESTYIAKELGISTRAARYRLQTLNNRLIVIEYQSDEKTSRS